MIINLNYFYKKDCNWYLIFFTFVAMKKNQNKRNGSFFQNKISNSFLKKMKLFFTTKDTFSFDVFPYLKAENEKLQIVFENIRV
jgi:hypothetical protein